MSRPLSSEIVDAFNDGQAPEDVVTRSAPATEPVADLHKMIGQPVIFRDWEMTADGIRQTETEAILFSVDGFRTPPDAA